MIKVYDRETKEVYEEGQYGEGILNFLYHTKFGRILLKFIINPTVSKIGGLYNNSFLSKGKIPKWVEKYNIDLSLYEKKEYKCFNDFFTRKLKSSKKKINKNIFVSPCDGKLLVYDIKDDLKLKIKNSIYTLNELVKDEVDLEEFRGGKCFLYHLTVDCYHRYCFIDDGKVIKSNEIKGVLHTISSISKDYKIYKENHRVYSLLETANFDDILVVEVGALMVGKIKNNGKTSFKKGDEKGYFELGGSTIIVLVKKDKVIVDQDILENSKQNIETKVKYLERVGIKND